DDGVGVGRQPGHGGGDSSPVDVVGQNGGGAGDGRGVASLAPSVQQDRGYQGGGRDRSGETDPVHHLQTQALDGVVATPEVAADGDRLGEAYVDVPGAPPQVAGEAKGPREALFLLGAAGRLVDIGPDLLD